MIRVSPRSNWVEVQAMGTRTATSPAAVAEQMAHDVRRLPPAIIVPEYPSGSPDHVPRESALKIRSGPLSGAGYLYVRR